MALREISADEIYSSLADDAEFGNLPTRLVEAFGGRSAIIMWQHNDGASEILAHSGYFTNEQLLRYGSEFAQHDPWAQASARAPQAARAVDMETLVPSIFYERSHFYNEFIRKMGDDTYRCLGVRIRNERGVGIVAIHRGKSQNPYEPDLVPRLTKLAVHLGRVLSVRGELEAHRREANSFRSLLECIPQVALVVDVSGTLLFANMGGESMLRTNDVLLSQQGRIEGVADRGGVLLKAIRLACASPGAASSVLLGSRSGHPCLATVIPVPVAAPGKAKALILMQDRTRPADGLKRQLQSLYGLTSAEAAVARRLAQGSSLLDIASERDVSLATVRAQMKVLSQKMGCHRQAEVVSIVNSVIPA